MNWHLLTIASPPLPSPPKVGPATGLTNCQKPASSTATSGTIVGLPNDCATPSQLPHIFPSG